MEYSKNEALSRTEMLLGCESMKKLSDAKVIIFGVGGVGGHAFEALVRSGIENITVVDSDTVSVSNLNRQIIATVKNLGRLKVEVAKERALDINPDAKITALPIFYSEKNENEIDLAKYDYIIDAIDSVSSKIRLIENATIAKTPIISSMGAANKLNPSAFKVSDIYKTSVCPLARALRSELKKREIKKLKCVYSEELPIKREIERTENVKITRPTPASIATVPSVAGLILASEVIKDLTKNNE